MKKIFLIFGIAIQGLTAFGQSNRFETGLEGGPTMTTLWGNDALENKANLSGRNYNALHYTQGLFVRWNFLPWLGIQSGLNYEKIGNYIDVKGEDWVGNPINGYEKADFEYLSMPILLKFQTGNKLKINFSAGGFVSYLLTAKGIVRYDNSDPNNGETTYDQIQNFQRFNSGVLFGVGLDYTFNNGINLGLEARDQLGLYNISELPISHNQYIRTNSLQLLFRLSYKFGYAKEDVPK